MLNPIFLLTFDVEPNIRSLVPIYGEWSGMKEVMPRLLDIVTDLKVSCTWFITHDYWAHIDDLYPTIVERMAFNGEIGCHTHFGRRTAESDNLDSSPLFQKELIEQATHSLRQKGYPTLSFRGGAGFLDKHTLRILCNLNYSVDSSITPGFYTKRFDGLVIDHRRCTIWHPYYPSWKDHCLPGDSPILEVPFFKYPLLMYNNTYLKILGNISYNLKEILDNPDLALKRFRRLWEKTGSEYPIEMSWHPYNFFPNVDEKLSHLRRFLELALANDFQFWTMQRFSKAFPRDNHHLKATAINVCLDLNKMNRLRQRLGIGTFNK